MGVATGKFLYPNQSAVANGLWQWKLSGDGVSLNASCNVPILISGLLDTNGNMTATFAFNDTLAGPSGATTTYQLTVKDVHGGQVWNETYYLTGTAANINTILPTGPPGSGGSLLVVRLILNGGTALGAGNFALSAGWGSTAAVSGVVGFDSVWQITVTPSGSGIALNPTVTLTFADGAWPNPPVGVSKSIGGTGGIADTIDATTTTAWTITFVGLPVSGSTYIFEGTCVGR